MKINYKFLVVDGWAHRWKPNFYIMVYSCDDSVKLLWFLVFFIRSSYKVQFGHLVWTSELALSFMKVWCYINFKMLRSFTYFDFSDLSRMVVVNFDQQIVVAQAICWLQFAFCKFSYFWNFCLILNNKGGKIGGKNSTQTSKGAAQHSLRFKMVYFILQSSQLNG